MIRRSTRSPLGKASGSPSARIAMYCAVQAPIPGIACSAATVSLTFARASRMIPPFDTRRASKRIVSARAGITPARSTSASISCPGVGNNRTSPALPLTFEPHSDATRPAIVVAPRTEICWPTMARTASSKPSQAPGVRMPGCCKSAPSSNGSAPRCPAMTAGSAPRSNSRRTRSTMDSNARQSGNRTSTVSAVPESWREMVMTPGFPSTAMVRR